MDSTQHIVVFFYRCDFKFLCFPNACVRVKHSAWISTAPNRADARTHYQQKKGLQKSLPPRGRGTAIAVEGACVPWNLDWPHNNALSLSRLTAPAPSRREPFRIVPPIEKHHQRKFLGGVRYFSAKIAEARGNSPFFYFIWNISRRIIKRLEHNGGRKRDASPL